MGKFLAELKPDVLVNCGDAADMSSLSSYDKGKRSSIGKSYKNDLNSHLDFQERLWAPIKRLKKKMPYSVVLEGNHEHRIEKALDLSPEYAGTIGFKDYQFDDYYDRVVRYSGGAPGVIELDDILFAHYFVTGVSGRPIGGERAAAMHMAKINQSTVAAHSHLFDYYTRTNTVGKTLNSLVVGCYQDYSPQWCGESLGNLWRRGVVVLRNVEHGDYDLSWVSIESLRKEYG